MDRASVQTTALIVEFLIAGALVSLALVVCAYSVFPNQMQSIFNNLVQYRLPSVVHVPVAVLLTTAFIAIAYGIGIFFEYIGLTLFEGWHDEIKRDRMKKYLKELENDNVDLSKSLILRKFEGKSPEEITKKQARSCIGPMRFYVLMKSPELYQDIASQLHRLRLIRIMFFVEFILMVAVVWKVLRNLPVLQNISLPSKLTLIFTLIFLLIVLRTNFEAILSRFNRYCRAVERSYKTLLVDQGASVVRTAPQTGYERKILNTRVAHQEYSNPLVGIVVFLFDDREIAVFEENGTWKLPESYAQGNEYLEEAVHRVLADYLINSDVDVKSYALLSGRDYREDVYQYDYIACVRISKGNLKPSIQPKWIPKDDLKNINIDPAHKKFLENHFDLIDSKDKFIVPTDPSISLEPDENLSKGTTKLHAEHGKKFPMPSITVDGILLKFSKSCKFEGIILEKRSRKVDREPGKWAFPGGFVYAHETALRALIREVREETRITLEKDQFLSVHKFGTGPDRDPRYFVWTQFLVFYTMKKPDIIFYIKKRLGIKTEEIEDARVFSFSEIPWNEMAFDHGDVLKEFIDSLPYYITRVEKNKCPP